MTIAKSAALFVLAALAEIGGAWLIWQGGANSGIGGLGPAEAGEEQYGGVGGEHEQSGPRHE
jgi:small multidrug resistance family-3 protein